MPFEPVIFLIAAVIGLTVGLVLHLVQRPKLSGLYLSATIVGTIVGVYYILNVVFGSGRTGWP